MRSRRKSTRRCSRRGTHGALPVRHRIQEKSALRADGPRPGGDLYLRTDRLPLRPHRQHADLPVDGPSGTRAAVRGGFHLRRPEHHRHGAHARGGARPRGGQGDRRGPRGGQDGTRDRGVLHRGVFPGLPADELFTGRRLPAGVGARRRDDRDRTGAGTEGRGVPGRGLRLLRRDPGERVRGVVRRAARGG